MHTKTQVYSSPEDEINARIFGALTLSKRVIKADAAISHRGKLRMPLRRSVTTGIIVQVQQSLINERKLPDVRQMYVRVVVVSE